MLPGEEIIAGMERRGLFDCIPESSVVVGAQLAPSRAPDPCPRPRCRAIARAAHSAEDWRRHGLVHGQAFEGAIEDGAGKRGARLRLDAALEAAGTTCFVAGGSTATT